MKHRRCPKIQLCPRCGQMRCHHPGGLYSCPVPETVLDALRAFRAGHGRRWKSKLCHLWQSSAPRSPELQQARNMIGPRRLDKITL
jgi:molybdenum cofactor biosynthesis enzyme MoaA